MTRYGAENGAMLLVIAAALFPILAFALDKTLHLGLPLRYLLDLSILVLTYVMLGFGLNIVVGLAGLLDLGYVAFYAVGAYTFALLAAHFGCRLLDVPAARRAACRAVGRHARLSRASAARRLSRHRDARLRRDRAHRAAQLDAT